MKPLVFFLTMFIKLTGCNTSGSRLVENNNNLSTSSPKGHWTLSSIKVIEDKQSVEKYNQSVYEPDDKYVPVYMDEKGVIKPIDGSYLSRSMKDLVITDDSIAWMNYPLQMQALRFYRIESDQLKIENDTSQKSIELNSDQDTLRISYMDRYGLFLEETYKKTTFNDSILNILVRYKINLPELAGTWELIRKDSYEYGQKYELDFPHTIPDMLVLTKEDLVSTLFLDRSCQNLTDGKKRKYFMNYKDGELLLTPDKWYSPTEWRKKGRYVDKYLRYRKIK